jgi:ABC-type glycerol-3-phosphate transport system substrate-binding protein
MFDAAGIPYPKADTSLTIQEYAEICRKLAKPDKDPVKTVYGCSMPEWAPGIQSKDVFGEDGRSAEGNLNSPEMVDAFNIAGQLVREKAAPGGTALTAIGESDLFAQGRLGITWTDFTETPKYDAAGLQFGLAPFLVIKSGESFVDTWTAPWGTFTESTNQPAALEFLRWLATDGQVVRMQTSADHMPSPITAARGSGSSPIRAKPPGSTVHWPSRPRAANTRKVKGRATSASSETTGMVESWTTSCPT